MTVSRDSAFVLVEEFQLKCLRCRCKYLLSARPNNQIKFCAKKKPILIRELKKMNADDFESWLNDFPKGCPYLLELTVWRVSNVH